MTLIDAWIMAGLSFIAGGFFGAGLQLRACTKDIERLSALLPRRDREAP